MDDAAKLEILKLNLNRTGPALDPLLLHYLKVAAERIQTEGITLTGSADDAELQIAYAAHLFRNRADSEPAAPGESPLPKDLRWALNNRLFSEKGRVDA